MTAPPTNRSLTAVPGVLAGHATDGEHHTGVTAVLFPEGARAGVHVPGSATGSRELGVLAPGHLARAVHGFCLSGGSAFGLASADGVVEHLHRAGIGFPTEHGVVPIVPAAILFDLHTATRRPGADDGRRAAAAASQAILASGRVGAGTGARVGLASGDPAEGGFGSDAVLVPGGVVAVGVAVNALGSVRDPDTGAWIAGGPPQAGQGAAGLGEQTTLAVVATDVPLDREACTVVARMASAGLARTLYPAFTPFDGDVVFVASTGTGSSVGPERVAAIGDAAATAVAHAVIDGVRPRH